MNWYGGYASTVINEETNAGLGIVFEENEKIKQNTVKQNQETQCNED